jgi:hypothetical protein
MREEITGILTDRIIISDRIIMTVAPIAEIFLKEIIIIILNAPTMIKRVLTASGKDGKKLTSVKTRFVITIREEIMKSNSTNGEMKEGKYFVEMKIQMGKMNAEK